MAHAVARGLPRLPHWVRVAFAARCAQGAWPLFERAWPAATLRLQALRAATRLAEESAALARPADGLAAAQADCVAAVGAAIIPLYANIRPTEPTRPMGEDACRVASFAAKAAEWAADAARKPPAESAASALEAFAWARDAADLAGDEARFDRLLQDFEAVWQAARQGRWSDSTPCPTSAFDRPDAVRPWWRPW